MGASSIVRAYLSLLRVGAYSSGWFICPCKVDVKVSVLFTMPVKVTRNL